MSLSSDTPRENLTLTEADLAVCRPIVGEGGHVLRAFCPFHGSNRQRSLRVQVQSGRFVCFACGAWGYMETARAQWREEQQRQAALQRPPARRQRVPHRSQPPSRLPRQPVAAARQRSPAPSTPRPPAPERPGLAQQLAAFQAALPGSRGAAYLQQRGIPLALALQYGVGYAAPGTWPHAARDWRGGRVVFPHTMPDGHLVNLYGRAVDTAEEVPKAKRHDHLPGEKGYFNAAALQAGAGPLWVCEGAFDALALLAADIPRVVAIFGVQGWRWDWVREICALVFAFDADIAGQQQWRTLAWQAALRGKRVAVLPEAAYGGCNDVSEAWAAGVLCLDGGAADLDGTLGYCVTQERRETWTERVAIMVVDGGLPQPGRAWHGVRRAGTGQPGQAGLEYGRQRHTHTRRRTTMDTDDKLRSIFGNLRGGRLEDVADKLIALFREPDWWEEDFEKQFVARGSIEAFQDAEKCDAVKAFIRTLLTRAQHEERQKLLTEIARLRENVFASAASPEETSGAVKLYDCLLHDLRQKYATPQAKPGS